MLKTIAKECFDTMLAKKKTIFTAESCTGGLIAATLAEISGVSQVLLGGIVTYNNQMKQQILNVSEDTLLSIGEVSFECVEEMAKGALQLSGADYIISISGIAGPNGGTEKTPIGTIFTSVLSKSNGGWSQHFQLSGTREEIQKKCVELALRLLIATENETDFFDLSLKNAREI